MKELGLPAERVTPPLDEAGAEPEAASLVLQEVEEQQGDVDEDMQLLPNQVPPSPHAVHPPAGAGAGARKVRSGKANWQEARRKMRPVSRFSLFAS